VVQTANMEEVAGILVDATIALLGTTLEDRALPSRSAKFAINLTMPPLSVGIGLKRTSSPTTARVQDTQRPTVLTKIGMLIVELLTTSKVSSRS
jgi:hypothetical protein